MTDETKTSSSYEIVPFGPVFRMIVKDGVQASHIFLNRGQLAGMRRNIDRLLGAPPRGNRAQRRKDRKS